MIDVVIPVKNRPEVERCIRSLLPLPQIDRILLCDGGSGAEYSLVLAAIESLPKVEILQLPMTGFNKSYLMNQGILRTTAKCILISDADIKWNELAIEQLKQSIQSVENSICTVHQVSETNPSTAALKRDRYTYQITHYTTHRKTQNINTASLSIEPATTQHHRLGCGLMMAHRTTLLQLRGYKEIFQGWGWEDQDLLIRAQLLGIQVNTAGQVLHLSHTDDQRNLFYQHYSPSFSRNWNILRAIGSILQKNLSGNIPLCLDPLASYRLIEPETIHVYLPSELRTWLYELSGEGIADYDLSWARNAFKDPDRLVATSVRLSAKRI